MNSKLIATSAAAAVLMTGSAYAASAKFAADWASNTVKLAEISQVNNGTAGPGAGTGVGATELMAVIHIPQNKEALIGVSGVADLITLTEAKGKNEGGEVTAVADASMDLEVRLASSDLDASTAEVCEGNVDYYSAAPGKLTFAARKQTLTVDVDLDVVGAGDASIAGYVAVGLEVNTTAAHHFNFVAADLPSDNYDVVACFSGEAFASIDGDADGGSNAKAVVAIQHRMVTVQQVRAVKGSIESSIINVAD